jgi:hypothetical protein
VRATVRDDLLANSAIVLSAFLCARARVDP